MVNAADADERHFAAVGYVAHQARPGRLCSGMGAGGEHGTYDQEISPVAGRPCGTLPRSAPSDLPACRRAAARGPQIQAVPPRPVGHRRHGRRKRRPPFHLREGLRAQSITCFNSRDRDSNLPPGNSLPLSWTMETPPLTAASTRPGSSSGGTTEQSATRHRQGRANSTDISGRPSAPYLVT